MLTLEAQVKSWDVPRQLAELYFPLHNRTIQDIALGGHWIKEDDIVIVGFLGMDILSDGYIFFVKNRDSAKRTFVGEITVLAGQEATVTFMDFDEPVEEIKRYTIPRELEGNPTRLAGGQILTPPSVIYPGASVRFSPALTMPVSGSLTHIDASTLTTIITDATDKSFPVGEVGGYCFSIL